MTGASAMFDDLLPQLQAAARANRRVEAGQVHLVHLDGIISRAGRHWPSVQERIRSGSVSFLRGCVDERDIIIPCGDGFLIVFADGEPAELGARCAEIEGLLTAFYTGQDGLEGLLASVEQRVLEPSDVEIIAVAPERPPPEETLHVGDHDIARMPVWAARANVSVGDILTPTYCDAGVMRLGYDDSFRISGVSSESCFAEIDLVLVDAAKDILADADDGGLRGICVHSSTLRQRKARINWLNHLVGIPEESRKRMVVKLSEIDLGTPVSTIRDWIGHLRRCVPHVKLEFHHLERVALSRLRETGAASAGLLLPSQTQDISDAHVKVLVDLAGSLARQCERQGLKSFVGQVRTTALAHDIAAQGVELMMGPAWPGQPVRAAQTAGAQAAR